MTQERLKCVLSYDKNTGIFRRLIKTERVAVGEIVGGKNNGYLIVAIDGTNYKLHRLAWLYVYGEFPSGDIDHINHDRADNRIVNLRDVTIAINNKNKTMFRNNTSGVTGVNFNKSKSSWDARISVCGERVNLGSFVQFHEAVNARKNAEVLYEFHKNHGE